MKEKICSAANTIVPAYLTMISKSDAEEEWKADSEDIESIAEDPLTLPGLSSIFESRGRNWKASD